MFDLNDLRIFQKVALLRSFSAAARALSQPRSNISRGVSRLEASLGTRLIHRTTREVELTAAGQALMEKSTTALDTLGDALVYIGAHAADAHGDLRVSVGIGFGINVLTEQLPGFLLRYPDVDVHVDLTSRPAELISERVDVAIRFGPLPDSSMVAVRLGELKRLLCAAPSYLERRGRLQGMKDLADHDLIEMPRSDGRPRTWTFTHDGDATEIVVEPRVSVNDALSIHRLVLNGAGVGIVSCYLCAPDVEAGRLVHLFPEWAAPSLEVNMIFPSRRELSPAVRGFVDYMKEVNQPGLHWQNNEMPSPAALSGRVST